MLQQTRVETAIPYYERFLARFPSVDALAAADEQDVLKEWSGLGYYARARNLKRAAETLVRDHAGRVPRDRRALEALPGLGPYTVGAILSIAFREPAAAVDGNVRRVLSRWAGWREPAPDALWSLAGALARSTRPDLVNQALMELGARLCTPRAPRCPQCPIAHDCVARSGGRPEELPAPRRRPIPREVNAMAGVLWRQRPRPALLVMRRPSRGLLGGLWELPALVGDDPAALREHVLQNLGILSEPKGSLGLVRHGFTHRTLTLQVIRLVRLSGRLSRSSRDTARFCEQAELRELPLSKLMRKTLALIGVPL